MQLVNSFDYIHAPGRVVIDLTHAHFWDTSAVAALDRVILKFRRHGAVLEVIGMNEASGLLIDKLATHRDQPTAPAGGH